MAGDGIKQITALLGACYFYTRDDWNKLGGYMESLITWGYSEECLGVKAAFMGIPILACGAVRINHWFQPKGPHPYPLNDWMKYSNRARVCRALFSERAYNEVWLPRLKLYQWGDDWEEAMKERHLLLEAAHFQAQKIHSDSHVFKTIFGLDWT